MAVRETKVFNINTSSLIVNSQPVTGLADGTSINVDFNDSYVETLDAHGTTTVTATNNYNAVATITLSMESPSNDLFSNIFNAGKLLGTVGVSFRLACAHSRDTVLSNFTYPTKLASIVQGNDGQSNRVWTFNLTNTTAHVGGLN